MPALFPLDRSPFGMGIYPSHRTSGETTEKAAQLAQEAGIRWTRDELGWAGIQPERDVWNWERFDRAVNITLEHGIQVLGLLSYGAPWAMSLKTADGKPDILSLPDLRAWSEYVGRTVERFRDRIHVWQMWNEPNIRGFWHPKPDPKEYARLLIAGANAAKKADPTCWVMGCNTSLVDLKFDRAVFDEGGWEHTDIIGVHPYRYPHPPERTDLLGDLLELAALSAEYGAVKPIWISEIGYATHTGPGGSSEWWSGVMLMRTYLTAWSSGLVQKLFWYDYRDDGLRREYNEHNFGILHHDWSPKMLYEVYRVMATSLEGFEPDGRVDLGTDLYVLRFRRGNELRLAAWTTGKNVKMPVPAPGTRVSVIKPWEETKTLDAPNGWATVSLDATPMFLVPA